MFLAGIHFCVGLDFVKPSLSSFKLNIIIITAMLTQLNDLRRKQSVIFIVATNRLRSFDAAVTRPGRFDFLLFVGTPNLSSRELRLVINLFTIY
jgi:SpoVK/Ycf46/Vps4 family AAA+-type ATPase